MDRDRIQFSSKDVALRADVHTLGAIVGEVIEEQAGPGVYERVERARLAAIRRREGDPEAEAELYGLLSDLSPGDASTLVRAFATYFRVVNLAEQVHRIRRRRDYDRERSTPQPDGLEATFASLAAKGRTIEEVLALLGRVVVEPVFTAHPTEGTRRTILEKEQRLARRLVERLDQSMTPSEQEVTLSRIRMEITAGWQTEEHPVVRPTVADEREHVLFYVTDVIYRVVPAFYEGIDSALERVFGGEVPGNGVPGVLRFASWVGGDMDGNPNVTAATIRESLHRHRTLVLERYLGEIRSLASALSQSASRVDVDERIVQRTDEYAGWFGVVRQAIPPRHVHMPYRVLLRLMAARLAATASDGEHGYETAAELHADLSLIAESLARHKGERAGCFLVRRALRRVETFGFHLVTLDIRQDARVHREAVGALLEDAAWADRPAAARAEELTRILARGSLPAVPPDEDTEKTLDVFRAIHDCRDRYGSESIGPYIISMAQGLDDVLSVLFLARCAGLADGGERVPMDVVPLLETVDDLARAPEILGSLFENPVYREHLSGRGDSQMVMVGYSDSSKDGGMAASRWALHRAQEQLVEVFDASGIDFVVFHGRGGTIGRGGGKTHRAVLAAPPGAVNGRLRVTEQGEVIDAKYGLRGIALRTLERMTAAVVRASMPGRSTRTATHRTDVLTVVADESRRAYRALVHEHPQFVAYFREATPIDVIERMNIGSRPPSRRTGEGVGSLRAIPWVFSWTQSRHLLPGWYGLGSGLEAAVSQFGLDEVAEIFRTQPFAATLVEDAEMVLAKADLGIAARYAALAGDAGRNIFPIIEREFDRTVAHVLAVRGSSALLDGDATLRRSIHLRNPYVDPMSLIQLELLPTWRGTNRTDDALLAALLETVNGIAQGLQNTG